MRFVGLLYLPAVSVSARFRAYTHPLSCGSILEAVINVMRRNPTEADIAVLHDAVDFDALLSIPQTAGVKVHRTAHQGEVAALAQLAAQLGQAEIAILRIEAALGPADLLERCCGHHLDHGNHLTTVDDIPPHVAPLVVHAPLLAALGRLDFDTNRSSLQEMLIRWSQIRNSDSAQPPIRYVPASVTDWYTWTRPIPPKTIHFWNVRHALKFQAIHDVKATSGLRNLEAWLDTPDPLPPVPTFPARTHSDSLRVLFYLPTGLYSGAEEAGYRMIAGMSGKDVQRLCFVTLEGMLSDRLRNAGCDVQCANWDCTFDSEDAATYAREVIAAARPDVIHANSWAGWPLLKAASNAGIPVVQHLRSAIPKEAVAMLEKADHLVAVSEFVRTTAMDAGLPAERITVEHDGVDTEHFNSERFVRDEIRRQLGIPASAVVVLNIARMIPAKRHDVLLHAFAMLQDVPELELLLVGESGDAAYERSIRSLAARPETAGGVRFLAFQENIANIHAAADILAFPAERDALGVCVQEAMSMRTAVIVASSGGAKELVEDHVRGIVVPAGDAVALAHAIRRLAADSQLRARLGNAARQYVQSQCEISGHSRRILELLRRAVRSYHRPEWRKPSG